MLFTRNNHEPIYNSLHDFKSDTTINEWFNLTVYDEATLLQTAKELESLLNKIPHSYFTQPPFNFKYFQSPHRQLTFNDVEDHAWFRQFFHSPQQLDKHYPLAIPHESQINRFKNQGITPLRLLAVFYFIVTVDLTHKIVQTGFKPVSTVKIPGRNRFIDSWQPCQPFPQNTHRRM